MSDTLELKGTIKLIEATQTLGANNFKKREFVITTPGDYQQDIKFEVIKDKCDSMDRFNVGDSVEVSFNVRGNEYNGKYYVNLQCWKLEADGAQQPRQPQQPQSRDQPHYSAPTPGTMQNSVDDGQDIPFAPIL